MRQSVPIQLVWFKRDLRIDDHQPLAEASARGPVLCLYVYEPEILASPEYAAHHHQFINESLVELNHSLKQRGGQLVIRCGEVVDILEELSRHYTIETLWSHAETGNAITFKRDRQVADWSHSRGIPWREFRQDGVIRRLKNRDGWSRRWDSKMALPITDAPRRIDSPKLKLSEGILTPSAVGLAPTTVTQVQTGGESAAKETLSNFLKERSVNYRSDMSSPVEGWSGCSRLSPYLAWGCISMRAVSQATQQRALELKQARTEGADFPSTWLPSLRSFKSRLHWHCHFMQKLEDEPEMEFQNICRSYDGMREDDFDEVRFTAWCRGETGYPMVDACMRCLTQTGWLNFRMRAMLVSFASYHLWLHWRRPAIHLGRLFLDFEPGIHYSQVQMQSGTTGINTPRIYSPIKQAKDQDPTGTFIRHWIPELRDVPLPHIAEPQKMSLDEQSQARCCIGVDYPAPIVVHVDAYRSARQKITAFKRAPETREAAKAVLEKHGSRKGARRNPKNSKKPTKPTSHERQLNLS